MIVRASPVLLLLESRIVPSFLTADVLFIVLFTLDVLPNLLSYDDLLFSLIKVSLLFFSTENLLIAVLLDAALS